MKRPSSYRVNDGESTFGITDNLERPEDETTIMPISIDRNQNLRGRILCQNLGPLWRTDN
jgi:hypothetical protein